MKHFQLCVSWGYEVNPESKTLYGFRTQMNDNPPIESVSGASDHPQPMSLVSFRLIHLCIFVNPIPHNDCLGDIQYLCQNIRHRLHIPGEVAAFPGIWFNSRCTQGYWHILLWLIDQSIFPNLSWQSKQSGQCWVAVTGYVTPAHWFMAKPQLCRQLIEVHVHRRMIAMCLELHYDRSHTAYLPIPFGKKTVDVILSTCVRI